MVPVKTKFIPSSKYPIKCPYSRNPSRIVVHNTGNVAPAANEVAYMSNNDNEVSFHVAVDDKEIIQAIPFTRNAWASGDGRGKGNMYGIHIEICYSNYAPTDEATKAKFISAEKNAAEYIAYLLHEYGWDMSRVTKHQDYDGKYCPHRTLDLGWGRFLAMVEKYLKKFKEEEDEMTYEQWKEFQTKYESEKAAAKASKWAEKAIEDVKAKKIMVGDGNGKFRPHSAVTRQELAQVISRITTDTKAAVTFTPADK